MIRGLIFLALLVFSAIYVTLRGTRDERVAIAALVIGSVLTGLAVVFFSHYFLGFQANVFAIDMTVFAVLVALALVSERYWPVWLAGFQLVNIMVHLVMLLNPGVLPKAYSAGQGFWAYPQLIVLIIVVWARRRRIRHDRQTGD